MYPMNDRNDPTLNLLVAEFEALADEGVAVFLEEKAYMQLIEYYGSEEIFDRALEVIDHALKHYPFSSDFFLKKASLLLNMHEEEEALNVLEQANIIAPKQADISLLKAEIYISLDQQPIAEEILNELRPYANREVMGDIHYVEALIYESREEYERMFYSLKAALLENHKHKDALERLWLCVEFSKEYEKSVKLHQEILDEDPYSHLAWYNLGHAQSYLGNYEEAIEAYEYAFIIDPKFEFAYRDCAELCFELKKYRKALQCYLEAIEQFEADGDLLLNIGECYRHLLKYKTARNFYQKAIELDPLNDEVFFHIGQCYAKEESWNKAIRYYKKAISIENTREEYHHALAEVYTYCKDWTKADRHFQKAISIAPDESLYWISYSQFLITTEQKERALNLLEEAEGYALSSEITYCRIACLFLSGRRKEASYWLGEALEEDFEEHPILFKFNSNLAYDPDVLRLLNEHYGKEPWEKEHFE